MRNRGLVLATLTLALVACGGDDDDSTADTRDTDTTSEARDDDPAAQGRDDFCAALDRVDDAAVARNEDAMRSGFRALFDAIEETGGDQLRALVDDLRDAEGSAEFADALNDAANYCD
jgi:hypothetical protein